MPSKIYLVAHYSEEDDAPEKPREYGGLIFTLKGGDGIAVLDDWVHFDQVDYPDTTFFQADRVETDGIGGWEYASTPPSVREVGKWLVSDDGKANPGNSNKKGLRSQVR